MRVDGLAGKLDADAGAHDAARAVAAGQIAGAKVSSRPSACCSDAVTPSGSCVNDTSLVPNSTRPPRSFNRAAQDVERTRLQQHPHARIGHVGGRLALFDAVEFGRAERLWPVPRHRRIILSAGFVHFVDDAEVVIDLERAWLDALAARAGAMIRRHRIGFDDADGDAAPRQIAGQHQAGRPGAGNQDFYFGQTTPGRVAVAAYPHRRRRSSRQFHSITSSARREHGGRDDDAQRFGGFQIDRQVRTWSAPAPAGSAGFSPLSI